jgi:hypothetical protein
MPKAKRAATGMDESVKRVFRFMETPESLLDCGG